ncbi:SWIB complex BAF60b domain-containing protein [Tasmannia lanceolata]|uniref:SWIB complex BAF60b domain-containing protein n=1 Tax=Tasmannia lanceolata TaxID=3420 RepID=UPI004062A3EF
MVSDQEIANGLESVLRQTGPNAVISFNGVVQQLEAKLGLDLSHKASFIRDQIDLLIRPPKDHFALQHHPQFQSIHPQFTPHIHHPHPHHHHEVGFRSQPVFSPPPPPQQQPNVVVAAPAPPAAAPATAPATETLTKESAPTPTGAKRRGGPGGLNKVCGVSPALQAVVGEPTMPRTQIVKELWAYIRKNNLQDPSNKRKIICNDTLRLLFETDCTDMFKMNKLLAKHIIPLEPSKDSGSDRKRLKVGVTNVEAPSECSEPGTSHVIISDALAKFFGTGEREMLPSEAVKRVWDYVKVNQLEDRMNSMVIICDAKLQEVFGCEKLSALDISGMLMRHLFKRA